MLLKDNLNCFEGTSFIFRKLSCQKTYLEIQPRVCVLACACMHTHLEGFDFWKCSRSKSWCPTERLGYHWTCSEKKNNGWRLSPSPSREQARLPEGLSGKTLNLFTAVAGTLTRPLFWTWLWGQRMPCSVCNWKAELPWGGWRQVSLSSPRNNWGQSPLSHPFEAEVDPW